MELVMVERVPEESESFVDYLEDEVEHTKAQDHADPNADLVQFYFSDIRPISSLLTIDEEQDLANAVQQGKAASDKLDCNAAPDGNDRARLESIVATGNNARNRLIVSN